MKQLLQNLRTGEGTVAEVPVPVVQPGRVLVRTAASLISAGTERALAELGRKGLLGKARERPDLIGKVWEKVKADGLVQTLEGVRDKLDQSHTVGYSASGIVIETANDVTDFGVGDRVACAGTGVLCLELCGKQLHRAPQSLQAAGYVLRRAPRFEDQHCLFHCSRSNRGHDTACVARSRVCSSA